MKYWIIGLSIYFAYILLSLYIKSDFVRKWVAPAIALFFIVQFFRTFPKREMYDFLLVFLFLSFILVLFFDWIMDYPIPWLKKWHKEKKEELEENRW